MGDVIRLKVIEGGSDSLSTLRILRPGNFPAFNGGDPDAPEFLCGACDSPLVMGIPVPEAYGLAAMADGIECAGCLTVREVPRQ